MSWINYLLGVSIKPNGFRMRFILRLGYLIDFLYIAYDLSYRVIS